MARVLLLKDEPNIASIIVFKLKRPTQLPRLEAQLVPARAGDPR